MLLSPYLHPKARSVTLGFHKRGAHWLIYHIMKGVTERCTARLRLTLLLTLTKTQSEPPQYTIILTHFLFSSFEAVKITFTILFLGPFPVEFHPHGRIWLCSLVGCSMNCMKFIIRSCMCAKSPNDNPY